MKWLGKLSWGWALLLISMSGVYAPVAHGSAIEYQLAIPDVTVHLGSQTFTGDTVTFSLVGDDSNVIAGSIPSIFPGAPDLTFNAIYQGNASVTISDASGVLATANFFPNQIVVSIDHQNDGIGFGWVPGGVGASGFDVSQLDPLYPAGITCTELLFSACNIDGPFYDLTLAYAESVAGNPGFPGFAADGSADFLGATFSCDQFGGSIFGGTCASPSDIPTDEGAFSIDMIWEPTQVGNQNIPLTIGEFTASPVTAVPEPGTAPLVLGALLFLLWARRPNFNRQRRLH